MNKTDKIQQRKAALLEKLKELEKVEAEVASEAKKTRKRQDDRVKLLLGVLAMQYLSSHREAKETFAQHADRLSANERKFLASAQLWEELGIRPPQQELKEGANRAATPQSAAVSANAPSAPSAQAAGRIAQVNTPLRVPFAEKEEAKSAGAKFDTDAKHWYVPTGGDLARFAKWL